MPPRQVLKGATYLITRRCSQRLFLLRPSSRVNRIFLFCLAHATAKFRIDLHAFCVLSNHYHILLTDPHANLPRFMHWLNEYVAKCLNSLLKRSESFWAPGSYSAVRLIDSEAILDKLVYLWANPVAAGLVSSPKHWPGLWSAPNEIDSRVFRVKRPKLFFLPHGKLPEETSLKLLRPKVFARLSRAALLELLERRLEERLKTIRRDFKAAKRAFMGRRRILDLSPTSAPKTPEVSSGIKPRIACADKARRIEALARLKEFLNQYRQALERFCKGHRRVTFPAGTYWMRFQYKVPCAAPT